MRLKELREERGLTQKELGKMIGGQQANIYNYEVGRTEPSIDILKQLANILGVSVGYLIGAEDEDGRTVSPELTELSEKERKLLKFFDALSEMEQDKLIADAEFYAARNGSTSTKRIG